jgi:hypothetical protein
LDTHRIEACWVGYNPDSLHAHCIYWQHKNSISIKCNIKFTSPTFTIYSGALPQVPQIIVPPLQALLPAATLTTLHVPTIMTCGPLPIIPGGMPPTIYTPQLPIAVPQPYIPFATDSSEEEMPEEEFETPSQPPPPLKGKGKAKESQLPIHKSMHIPKPSYYARCLLTREGTSTTCDIEENPSPTASEAEHCWYHPDWPGHSTSSTYKSNIYTPDFAYLAESKDLMQAATNESGNDPKMLAEA